MRHPSQSKTFEPPDKDERTGNAVRALAAKKNSAPQNPMRDNYLDLFISRNAKTIQKNSLLFRLFTV
jgi:hypothetical protein